MTSRRAGNYERYVKRAGDFVLSLLATIILSPLFLVLAILIKADSRGPVFFTQQRVGRDKRLFTIYKFRSMSTETPKDAPTHTLRDPNAYITRVGAFLRKTSLDELPQIINILKGDMSIIGPRPALWNQDDLVAERDRYEANALLPGLTGWAQVNGRDELPIPIKAEFDGYYAAHLSFPFDVKIFFATLARVFSASGVVEGGTGNSQADGNSQANGIGNSQAEGLAGDEK